jgi:hypothetical protein
MKQKFVSTVLLLSSLFSGKGIRKGNPEILVWVFFGGVFSSLIHLHERRE